MPAIQPDWDVIIIGAGGSGLAAACSVAEHGGRVLVLEKEPQPGGTTGIAIGSFTAAGTALQRSAGINDSPVDHAEDAGKFAVTEIESRNNYPLRRFFLNESAETLRWLDDMGLSFVGPSPEPPNRVPRMHNVVPGAKAYIAALQIKVQSLGVKLQCCAKVIELTWNSSRVTGVRIQSEGRTREFQASRGVVLAGGDYANNSDLIASHKGEEFREIEGINPHATGEGHELAIQAGARMINMDVTYGPELRFVPSAKKPFQQWLPASGPFTKIAGGIARRMPDWVMRRMIKRLLVTWQHPEDSLFNNGAILLNQQGERFVDERLWPQREIAVARQTGKIAYILLDKRLIELYSSWPNFISTAPDIAYAYVNDYRKLRPDVAVIAAELESVLEKRNIDVRTALRTIHQHNQQRAARHPMTGDRWCLLGPVKAYFTTTEGGAAINQKLQVIGDDENTIPGLYAVGQNGLGGMILWGHGLHIAWAMTSGRLVGKSIMQQNSP